MLTLAVVLVALPTLFAQLGDTTTSDERVVSYGAAILMLIVYPAYLVHSLRAADADPKTGHARWSKRASLIVLAITAVATGVLSEVLVKAIEPTIQATGISETFVGLIIVPALGNIAEHLSAVRIAWRGNLDFSMGIVFNSGLQVALFITAAAVLAGTLRRTRRHGRLPAARARRSRRGGDHGGVRDRRRRGELDRGARAGRDLHPRGPRVLVSLRTGPAGCLVADLSVSSRAPRPFREGRPVGADVTS